MESGLDLDEDFELLELDIDKISKIDNSFWEIYRPIKDNINAKESLVRNNPEMAIKIFEIHRDEELGDLFIRHYRNDREYNSAAYFISVDMGISIKRLREPSDFWTYTLEQVENPQLLRLDS